MNRGSMIQIPVMTMVSLVLLVVFFTGISYAIPPTIAVIAAPSTVGVSTSTNITVMVYDFDNWDLQGFPIPPWDVQLQCSGPGQGTFAAISGEMDSGGQYTTTFKADKIGVYTIKATMKYNVLTNLDPIHGTTETDSYTIENSTSVTVSNSIFIVPRVSYIPPAHNINIFGSPRPTSTVTPSTPTPASPCPTPTAAATTQEGQQSTPVISPGTAASPSPTASTISPGTSQQSDGGIAGPTTTYLAIAVVLLIVIVAIMAGYMLGNRKQ